jgi:ribose-phosphate pyrophosphokinase
LHQGQLQGFFNVPVDELTAVHLLSNSMRQRGTENLVVVTDLGFAKRARTFAELLNAPLAIVEKRREGNNDHAEVLNAIEARDSDAARQAMRRHILAAGEDMDLPSLKTRKTM